jgi:hypothetical protein
MKKVIIGVVLNRALATPIGMYFTELKYIVIVIALASALFNIALNTSIMQHITSRITNMNRNTTKIKIAEVKQEK